MPTLDILTAPAVSARTPGRPDALARATAGKLGRWLVPSLSDLFFIALFIWLFVAGGYGWQGLLADGDIGWHIRTGEHILDHGSVPRTDLFTYTKPGAEWFAWEWLSDVVVAITHRQAALKGVVLLAGVLITLWALLLLRQAVWRGANPWVALTMTLLGVSASAIHFLARPHLITLLFATIAVWLIESDRRVESGRLWLLVPLTALWTNLHGGFVVGIALTGLTAVGSVAEAWVGVCPWRRVYRYAALTLGCGAASLFNPYGLHLHAHIVQYLRSDWIHNAIQEFQAPTFRSENQMQYEVLLIAGLLIAAVLLTRRRFVEFCWILAFAHLSLSSARNVPVYIAIIVPILAEVVSELWTKTQIRSRADSAFRILHGLGVELIPGFSRTSIWLVVFVIAFTLTGSATKWPQNFPSALFPTAFIQAHQASIEGRRVFTSDQWGDYLTYAFYPRQRVFVDGRSDFLGPELGGDYMRAVQGDYRWRTTLDRYGVETVLAPVSWPLVTILKADHEWRVAADDGETILCVRR